MLNDDIMDDSLIERRQKEIKALKDEISALNTKVSTLETINYDYQEQINEMHTKILDLQSINSDLEHKLLIYEHDPIIYEESVDGFIIKVWHKDKSKYVTFAQFYESAEFEEDLEEFCKEFVLELKDAYLVE